MTYPARCPQCGSPVAGALASRTGVPIYGCGSYGGVVLCRPVLAADTQNLAALTRGDMRELLELVDMSEVAVFRASSAR